MLIEEFEYKLLLIVWFEYIIVCIKLYGCFIALILEVCLFIGVLYLLNKNLRCEDLYDKSWKQQSLTQMFGKNQGLYRNQ